MGCLLSKGFFKNDEVVPVTVRPLSFTSKTENGTTLTNYSVGGLGGKDRDRDGALPESQPQKQVVLTSRTVAASSSSLKQNGSVGLTNQNHGAPSARDVVAPTDEPGEKGTDNATNQNDAGNVANHNAGSVANQIDAASVANQNDSGSLANQSDAANVANQIDAVIVANHSDTDSLSGDDGDAKHVTSDQDGGTVAADTDSPPSRKDEDENENAATGASSENGAADDTSSHHLPANENDAADSTGSNPEAPPPFQMPEVEILKVLDGEGCPITLGKLFGMWTVPWPSLSEQIMRAQFFTLDDSDVILTGYAKSGSHWVWEMVHMLMTGQAQHCRIPKERLMFSFSTQEFFDTLSPPRVFNTHAPFEGLPSVVREGTRKCKMIYLLRNPKDLAVSYYHHLINQVDFEYEGNFHGYLDLFLEGKMPGGSWFDYVLGWEQTMKQKPDLPILVLHYEDIKEDPVAALQKLNDFLGVGRGRELLTEIADMCTISKMKAVEQEIKAQVPAHVNLSKTGKTFILRKGEVGDWQNWFTEDDDRRFMQAVDSRLQHSDLHFRYLLGDSAQGKKQEQEEEEEAQEEKKEE